MRTGLTLTALAALAYFLPWSTRKVLFSYEILGTEIANDFTKIFLFGIDIAVILALTALLYANRKVLHPASGRLPKLMFVGFIVWTALSLFAQDSQIPLGLAALARLVLAFAVFLMIARTPAKTSFWAVSAGLVVAGVAQSFLAISQFISQKSLGLSVLGESPLLVGQEGVATFAAFGEKWLRAYGTLPHPNILALFLVISLLSALALHQLLWTKNLKTANTLAVIIISAGLILTFSRIFIVLGALVALLWWLATKPGAKKKFWLGAAAIVIIFIGVTSVRPFTADNSFELRQFYAQVSQEQLKENPWLGAGLGQSVVQSGEITPALAREKNFSYQAWLHQPVHSSYLLVAAETGWPGFALFVLFLVFLTDGVIKKLRLSAEQLSPGFVFSALATFVLLAAMLFDHMLISSPNMLYLSFIIFGLLAAHQREIMV